MQYKELFIKLRQELDGFMLFFKQDIGSIRTSRATPSLVEDLQVEYFGTRYHIKELASLNVPEPRVLVIQPWDKNAMEAISGAIQKVTKVKAIRISKSRKFLFFMVQGS